MIESRTQRWFRVCSGTPWLHVDPGNDGNSSASGRLNITEANTVLHRFH